jgi:hypothetical protein
MIFRIRLDAMTSEQIQVWAEGSGMAIEDMAQKMVEDSLPYLIYGDFTQPAVGTGTTAVTAPAPSTPVTVPPAAAPPTPVT